MRKAKCNQCEACKRPPCDRCAPCLDLPRNGGQHKLRRRCIERRCTGQLTSEIKSSVKTKKKTKKIQKKSSKGSKQKQGQFQCSLPGCSSKYEKKIGLRAHVSSHFKDLIMSKYPWRKNSPCPICDHVIAGQVGHYLQHVSFVHKIVLQLLPVDDLRYDLAKRYFS